MTTNYKQFMDNTYITKASMETVKNAIPKELHADFDINFGFYYLKNNALVVNNDVKHTFKTKKQFNELVKQVIKLNTLDLLKTSYSNISIFKIFKNYNVNGNAIYNMQVMAVNNYNNIIVNITGTIGMLLASMDKKAILNNGYLTGMDSMSDTDMAKLLKDNDIKAYIGY